MTNDTSTGPQVVKMPAKVAAAIVVVARGVKAVAKNGENTHGKYMFASVDDFYDAVGPLMAAAGIFTFADMTRAEISESESVDQYGKTKRTSHLNVEFDICLVHESGEMSMPVKREVTVINAGPQAYASAESFITKYFIRNLFKVPTGDYDADEQSKDEAPAKPKSSAATKAPETPKQVAAAEAKEDIGEAKRKVAIAFAEQVNQFLDTNPTPEALFTYEGDPKINPKMKRIRSDEYAHVPAIAATLKRMNAIYATAPEREVGEDG